MSCIVNEHQDLQFPMETLWVIEREAHVTSSGTDEDKYGGTHTSSPTITFMGRRRCARGRCRVWMPLPHYPGLSQILNPMPYPPQVNFPPPPIMTPILIAVPPPPYSLPPPPILAPLMPAPPVTQAVAPVAQASMASITIPTPTPVVNPVAPATAPVIVVGGPPDPSPPPPPGSEPGSVADFDNMSVDLPPPQHPQYGGMHLTHGSQLVDSTSQT